jgi:hypothetical protein
MRGEKNKTRKYHIKMILFYANVPEKFKANDYMFNTELNSYKNMAYQKQKKHINEITIVEKIKYKC